MSDNQTPSQPKSMTITEFFDYLGSPECNRELKQKIIEMGQDTGKNAPRVEKSRDFT